MSENRKPDPENGRRCLREFIRETRARNQRSPGHGVLAAAMSAESDALLEVLQRKADSAALDADLLIRLHRASAQVRELFPSRCR